jgi:hypothetical protein
MMDRDQLSKLRIDRMRLVRARLALDNGETKETKNLTPFQKDAEEVFLSLNTQPTRGLTDV